MIELFDTHCHIHFPDYELDPEEVIISAKDAGVTRLMCVGCTLADSEAGIKIAQSHDNMWAAIGLHPHEAKDYVENPEALQRFRSLADKPKVVAVGECGLDYHYLHSSKEDQRALLRFQLDLAVEHNLPLIFHLRGSKEASNDAFDDFFAILSHYKTLRGVVHSFTANTAILDKIIQKGLYIGLNGIMTFTKDKKQIEMAKTVPLSKILLETDAPFLTPLPFRGTICEPKHARVVAEFLCDLRGETLEQIAAATTQNAKDLFRL